MLTQFKVDFQYGWVAELSIKAKLQKRRGTEEEAFGDGRTGPKPPSAKETGLGIKLMPQKASILADTRCIKRPANNPSGIQNRQSINLIIVTTILSLWAASCRNPGYNPFQI